MKPGPPIFIPRDYIVSTDPVGFTIPLTNKGQLKLTLGAETILLAYGETAAAATIQGSATATSLDTLLVLAPGENNFFFKLNVTSALAEKFASDGDKVFSNLYITSPTLESAPWFNKGLSKFQITVRQFIQRFKYPPGDNSMNVISIGNQILKNLGSNGTVVSDENSILKNNETIIGIGNSTVDKLEVRN